VNGAPLKVLVADDSPTARELLVQILRADPGLVIVGEAHNGLEAVEMTGRLRPDVVTMDIRMPVMDGFEATRRIMVETPTPIVIISSAYDARDVEVSMHALRVGALTVLPKPPGPGAPGFDDARRHLVQTVKAMAAVKVVRRWRERPAQTPGTVVARRGVRPRIVAMAASTGGPAALARILADMPADFALPLMVVQHIAAGFVEGLAAWLNTSSPLSVRVAGTGEPLQPGVVYLAPDDHHLTVADRFRIAIPQTPPLSGFRPSASIMFESVAHVFGASTVAVILTGMGDDGVAGLRAVRTAGGRILAQDAETSVVFGMPGAAVTEGLADAALPLDAIAPRLQELTRHEP
jgi:two-component system, chemotaxis family, protein-glutamate methylesterase/glutaminase